MKVTTVTSPNDIKQPTNNATAAKTRAIEAFNKIGQQEVEKIVQNQNQIAVEELSAIQAPTTDNSTSVEATKGEQVEVSKPDTTKQALQEDPVLKKQFQQLARQERQLRLKVQQQEQAIKAREEALKTREEALIAKDKQYQQGYISKDQLKQDTLKILADSGISYDELTQQILTQQPVNPRVESQISRLEAKIAELEAAADSNTKSYAQQQQDSYKAAVKQIGLDVKALVKSDPVTYEAVAKTGSINDVVELIEQTYAKDGVLLSVEDATQEVENYLVDEGVNTLSRIDKIKKKITASGATVSKSSSPQTQVQTKQTQMKTLTNATSSSRKLSAKERAILAFKGELKS